MILTISNLYAGYYEDINILADINFEVRKEKVTIVIGPNGAGKSTLLKTICGFLRPQKGKIIFNGEDITGLAPFVLRKKGLAYIPQWRSMFPQLSVEENLEMAMWIFRNQKQDVEDRLNWTYHSFPILFNKRKSKAVFLSGGEQKVLELAKGLIVRPKILLIDEPTEGLAPNLMNHFYTRIHELKKEGISVVLVDQNIRKAVEIADYVYMIELGRNKLQGPKEIFEKRLREIIKESLLI